MTNAITTTTTKPDIMARINEFQTIAKLFAASNLFTDAKGEAQCFVKILAGAELGIPPFTAMNSFHIIQGKPTMTAGTIAARVKASGRYDYQVLEKTSLKCVIQFFENGKPVHVETWDAARAQKAGVQNMGKFPDAMLFARCITAGARAVAPDIVGQFYTPEEMGAQVNAEGEVIQGESRPVEHQTTITAEATETSTPAVVPTAPIVSWKDQIRTLGKRAGELIASTADIGLCSVLSAAQSIGRETYAKNGHATQDEIAAALRALNEAIAAAEKAAQPEPVAA